MRNTQIGARNKHKYEAEHEVITPIKWLWDSVVYVW